MAPDGAKRGQGIENGAPTGAFGAPFFTILPSFRRPGLKAYFEQLFSRGLGRFGEAGHAFSLVKMEGKLMFPFVTEVTFVVDSWLLLGVILGGLGSTLAQKNTYRNRAGFRGFLGGGDPRSTREQQEH